VDFADTAQGWYPVDSMELDAMLAQGAESPSHPSDSVSSTHICDSADGLMMLPQIMSKVLSSPTACVNAALLSEEASSAASCESPRVPPSEPIFASSCDDEISDSSISQGDEQVASEHVMSKRAAHFNAAKCAGMLSLGDFLDEEVPRNPWSTASASIE